MKLAKSIEKVTRLSESMKESLDCDDITAALEILQQRGEAMESFVAADRAASEAERQACSEIIIYLKQLDRELQEMATCQMEGLTREMRGRLGASGTAQDSRLCLSGCFDRRA